MKEQCTHAPFLLPNHHHLHHQKASFGCAQAPGQLILLTSSVGGFVNDVSWQVSARPLAPTCTPPNPKQWPRTAVANNAMQPVFCGSSSKLAYWLQGSDDDKSSLVVADTQVTGSAIAITKATTQFVTCDPTALVYDAASDTLVYATFCKGTPAQLCSVPVPTSAASPPSVAHCANLTLPHGFLHNDPISVLVL